MENIKTASGQWRWPPVWNADGTRTVRSLDGETWLEETDPERAKRIAALVPPADEADAAFLAGRVLWPCGTETEPYPGVVWPSISTSFLFGERSSPESALSAVRNGKKREILWYLSDEARETLTPEERGDLLSILRVMSDLASVVRLLHRNGFSCLGLSERGVLVDIAQGKVLLTGAGEFRTGGADVPDLRRNDLHDLAVLFYRLVFRRSPADGLSEKLKDLDVPLQELFRQAFVDGARHPDERPSALQWETALEKVRRRREKYGRTDERSDLLRIEVGWESGNAQALDVSAFFLRDGNAPLTSADIVFYGNMMHASRSVWIQDADPDDEKRNVRKRMTVNKRRIPPEVARIDFVVTVYYEGTTERLFQEVGGAFLSVYDGWGLPLTSLQLQLSRDFGGRSACIVASLERRDGELSLVPKKVGKNGGLASVCRDYGFSTLQNSHASL